MSDTPASGLSATQQWLDRQLLRVLPAKLHQLTRFGVAGILATLLYFVLTNGIVVFGGTDPVAASIYAYLLSLIFSYLMQSRFAFRVAGDRPGQVLGFVATSLAGLAISYWIMLLASDVLALPYVLGALAVCVLIPLTNYVLFKYWVFARSPAPGDNARRRAE